MMAFIDGVLSAEDLARVHDELARAAWRDGKATAGPMARAVKANEQLAPGADADALARFVRDALMRHSVFQAAARPAALSKLMVSRYRDGAAYGAHTDDALMRDEHGARLRADVAFTLFLDPPEAYAGGALVITGPAGEQAVKLPAGALAVYPATSIHRVEPVTSGVRHACVGWAQSLVRDPAAREILFDLATLRAGLDAPRETLLLLDKAISNLLRRWAEV